MKKIALLGVLALAMGFTACDGYEEPNPPAQTNPQESIIKPEDISVATKIASGDFYDLDTYNAGDQNILLATIDCSVLPEGYEFVGDVEASADNFKSAFTVPSTIVTTEGSNSYLLYVSPDDLNAVYAENVTKSPEKTDLAIRFNVLTKTGNQLGYIGSPSNVYGPFNVTVVPLSPEVVIEEAYYLVGGFQNWVVANAVKFDRSELNQYDDPLFTTVVDITADEAAAGWQWKVIPQSTFAAGTMDGYTCFGPATADATFGELSATAGNGVYNKSGRWMITINMQSQSFEFTSALDYLTVISNRSKPAQSMRLYTSDFIHYTGVSRLYQTWYLTAEPAMTGINFIGMGDPETDPDTGVITGKLSMTSSVSVSSMIGGVDGGLYFLNVNTQDMSYENTPIKSIVLIGEFCDWDFAKTIELTPGTGNNVTKWTATNVEIKKAGGYKLAANHDWDINWGGSPEDLVEHGDNMTIEEGTYDFSLTFGQEINTLTVTKK